MLYTCLEVGYAKPRWKCSNNIFNYISKKSKTINCSINYDLAYHKLSSDDILPAVIILSYILTSSRHFYFVSLSII